MLFSLTLLCNARNGRKHGRSYTTFHVMDLVAGRLLGDNATNLSCCYGGQGSESSPRAKDQRLRCSVETDPRPGPHTKKASLLSDHAYRDSAPGKTGSRRSRRRRRRPFSKVSEDETRRLSTPVAHRVEGSNFSWQSPQGTSGAATLRVV